MSHFPSAPPPGAYVAPNQNPQPAQGFSQQQQQQQQPHYGYQPQASSSYGAPAPGYNPSGSHKPTKAFGQVFNQAVTQGKPMLDKLGKTISSKLGNKQPKQSTPQHLESYQNYHSYQQQQPHQQQGQPQVQQYQQTQPQNYQTQGQQFSSGPQSVYQTPQQSPYAQSSYGTPASGNLGQNNYFPQQTPPSLNQQAPQHPQTPQQQYHSPGPNSNSVEQSHTYGGQPPGKHAQVQFNQGQPQGLSPQTPHGQASGQQTGVIGGSQPHLYNVGQQHPPAANTPPNAPPPQEKQQQHQWAPPTPAPHQQPSPVPQSPPPFNPTPPPQQYNTAPPVPTHPNQQQPQQSQQSPQPQQQQWTAMSPVSPQLQQMQMPPSGSTPPHSSENQQPLPPTASSQQQQQQQQHHHHTQPNPPQQQLTPPPTATPHNAPPKSNPTEFIAELPADLGNLSIVEGSKPEQVPSNPTQAAQYQAYRPASGQNSSPGPGFTIPRRAVSTSSLPLADPWRFSDPTTELPTREFYIIADLIFDSLDRRFEPQNTGLLEASKVLESWRVQRLPEEAAQLFAHNSYSAFAKIWSLEGVPHIMVPCQPSLMPTWNFERQTHSHEVKISEASALASASYATYMPALNRAGWYKYFFLGMLHQPEELEKTLSAFCADTYKPGVFNQPDIQKRDKNESPALVSRATAISTEAVSRVCEEVVAQMQGNLHRDASQQSGTTHVAPQGAAQAQDAEAALKLHGLQMQQQSSNMMNHTMTQGGINFSSAAGNGYKPNYGSLV
ncbi:hypothetical protein N0V90_010692 [Kalmusia sp. IMI 367209]|nr:hypothetical protein N0V90_010692 [Kalmusia sp. IMI 367209]